jgi:DNA mismatch endonuclease (patch repair protein)
MASIRSKNTTPEISLRKALFRRGLRYRLHYGREKIDIAFPKANVAIFVDGCFWHSCPTHLRIPETHRKYWLAKLTGNTRRAKEKDSRLIREGWKVIHIWEHSIRYDLESSAYSIFTAVRQVI